ncbi:MAG: RNA polymerase sigma factor RpoD/SigA [Myxococcaceae bacterium]
MAKEPKKSAPTRSKKGKRPEGDAQPAPATVIEGEIVPEERPRKPAGRAVSSKDVEDAEVVEGEATELSEPEPEELEDVEPEVDDQTLALAPMTDKGTGIAATDPLTRYMREVGQHPLLTREQEHELAVKFRNTGDLNAAYKLVAANLRLVVKLAHEYHRNPIALLDLIQEGNIGLMQAVKKYDPDRGVKLSSYAAWWIRAYILRYIMDNWKMVKLGTTEAQRKLFFKLRQEQAKLSNEGFEVTPKLLAERLNVTEQDVVDMDQRLSNDELSLDVPVGDEGKGTRGERLAEKNALPADEQLASEELKQIFREKMAEFSKTLKDKEKYIFEKRLIADEPMTLQQIGDQYGVSRERARQIEAALIARMREYLRAEIPDFDLVAAPKD